MSPWKVILATVIIFAAGVFTGGVLVNRVQHPQHAGPLPPFAQPKQDPVPTPWFVRREFLDRMDQHLNLSREQYNRIARILKDSQERTRQITRRVNPEIQDELRSVRREIRTELTPEQAKKFDELQQTLRRQPRPPNETTEMRRGQRRDPPPLNARPQTNDP